MEDQPRALLLKFPGTNCDAETVRALEGADFAVTLLPVTQVEPSSLAGVDLVVLAGGFSYGDYVMAGRLAQLELELRLGTALRQFRDAGGHLLGICNGFQILLRLGLLPRGSLVANTSGRFICRWVHLTRAERGEGLLSRLPDRFELPVAHAEGRFVTDPGRAEDYVREGLVALRYDEPVNGSEADIAGLRDATGRVLGLMPHPERFLHAEDHPDPDWAERNGRLRGWGHDFFASIRDAVAPSAMAAGITDR